MFAAPIPNLDRAPARGLRREPLHREHHLARSNPGFEKRAREQKKRLKQAEKARRKAEREAEKNAPRSEGADEPAEDGESAQDAESATDGDSASDDSPERTS